MTSSVSVADREFISSYAADCAESPEQSELFWLSPPDSNQGDDDYCDDCIGIIAALPTLVFCHLNLLRGESLPPAAHDSIITGRPSLRGCRLEDSAGRTWVQRNRDAINARRRELYAADPEKHRKRAAQYRVMAKDKVNAFNIKWSAAYRARLRSEMISAYGNKCSCCGEDQNLFLQLDHIHNDGYLERSQHKTSTKLFARLKRAGWPKDRYQLLCANCNFGKMMNGGTCPHTNDRF